MEQMKRIYRCAYFTFKGVCGFLSPEAYIMYKIMNPIFQVIFFSMIATHSYGKENITPYVIGNAFLLCSTNAFFGVGATFVSERFFGTLKNMIASPCNKFTHLVSKSLFYMIDGTITVLIGLLTGVLLFQLRIPINALPFFLLFLLVSVLSACSMGLFIGSLGLLTRDINLLLNLAAMLLMSLSGANFPVNKLPRALQIGSEFLPLTHALKGLKLLLGLDGKVSTFHIHLLLEELLICLFYSIIAYATIRIMERTAKRKATIELF